MALRETARYAKEATSTKLAPTRKSLRSTDVSEDFKFVQNTAQEFKVDDKRTSNVALQEARQNSDRFQEEMGRLTVDLQEAFVELGDKVSDAYNYQGSEKFWAFVGKFSQGAKNRANQNRVQRLLSQTLDKKLEEIRRLNEKVNRDFKVNEEKYDKNRMDYVARRAEIIKRLIENQPKLKQVIAEVADFKESVDKLKQDLETGVVLEDDRPAKEKELAQLQINLFDAQLDEAEFLAIVKTAQELIKLFEEEVSIAQDAIITIRNMRVSQAQKHEHLQEMYKNAMVAVVARVAAEQYNIVDPAMNKATTEIHRNNLLTMRALAHTNLERAKKAPIDPEIMKEFIQILKETSTIYRQGINELEDQISAGPRTIDTELQQELESTSSGLGSRS